MNEKATALGTKRLCLQPHVLVISEDLAKLDDSSANTYLVIVQGDLDYEASSLVEAIEACLKTTFVFNLCYPAAAQSSWLFLQQAVLNLVTPKDSKSVKVSSLISDIVIC